MNIIIVGKMCAGKTLVAQHLCDNYDFCSLSLAGPIKEIEKNLDTMSNNDLYYTYIDKYVQYDHIERAMIFKIFDAARKIPREEPKPRKRLQYIGTNGFRKLIDQNVWIKITDSQSKELNNSGYCNVVIDDVRFLNEYQYFVDNHWYPIKLDVNKENQLVRIKNLYPDFDIASLEHASELDQDKIITMPDGITIDVNRSKEEVLKIIDEMKKAQKL
jgi:hypothetical protein